MGLRLAALAGEDLRPIMPSSVLDNVVSSQLVEAALGQDARGFSLLYGDLLVLLVGIPDGV